MRVKDRIFTRMREKEFVPHEEALALKELGFDESCFGRFNPDNDLIVSHTETYNTDFRKTLFTQAPTFSQAFRFFRDEYNLDYDISKNEKSMIDYVASKGVKNLSKYRYGYTEDSYQSIGATMSYEEAELACLKKLIKIVKEKNEQK